MAFDPDAYLAAKTGGDFDPDAYLAAKETPPIVDMSPAARRARAGMAPGPRELTAEQAGTSPGPIKTRDVGRVGRFGLASTEQDPAPADLPPGERFRVSKRHPGGDILGKIIPSDRPTSHRGPAATIEPARDQGELADPLMQMGTATALGMATGQPLRAIPVVGGVLGAGVEGAVASHSAGGSPVEGAALGLLPMAPAAARGAARAAKAAAQKVLPSTEKAIKNARGWVAKDIAGDVKSASTPTARKQLADDADNVATLVLKDRKLDKAIDRADAGNLDDLSAAQTMVRERLKAVEADQLAPHWEAATKALPGGGVRSGDVRDFLVNRVDELRASGLTSEAAEADALEGIVNRIQKAKAWGGGAPKLDPAAKVQGGALDGMATGDAIKLLEKSRTSATAADIDAQIAALRKSATTTGFNPDTIIPARQLQKQWADEAGIAYKSMGGIHGTVAFERKLDVAAHLRELRDDMLARVAAVDPRTAAALRNANREYSALKRIENVLDQRINHAKANAQGASFPAGAKRTLQQIKQSPTGWALTAVPEAMLAGKRSFDKWLARKGIDQQQRAAVRNIFEAPRAPGRGVPAAVAAGVPASVAMWAAEAADAGVKVAAQPATDGQIEAGNIDLTNRPRVKNADGSISTVRSLGVNIDGVEVLIPTVSEDGRIMSDDEAVEQYKRTGRHLGKFKSVEASNAFAEQLHNDQAATL